MKGIPQGRYTREFRQEAVKLIIEDKLSCREAARRLSLASSTLVYWLKAYKEGKLGDVRATGDFQSITWFNNYRMNHYALTKPLALNYPLIGFIAAFLDF